MNGFNRLPTLRPDPLTRPYCSVHHCSDRKRSSPPAPSTPETRVPGVSVAVPIAVSALKPPSLHHSLVGLCTFFGFLLESIVPLLFQFSLPESPFPLLLLQLPPSSIVDRQQSTPLLLLPISQLCSLNTPCSHTTTWEAPDLRPLPVAVVSLPVGLNSASAPVPPISSSSPSPETTELQTPRLDPAIN